MNSENKKIVLFDGVCNLCNDAVTFIIKHDTEDRFRFAALQEEPGISLIRRFGIDSEKVDSIILIDNNKALIKSAAALKISFYLSGIYPLASIFRIIPQVISDMIYDFIARNRYKWFGKKESCMIPTPELKRKFL